MSEVKVCPHCKQKMMIYQWQMTPNNLSMLRVLFFNHGYEYKKVSELDERQIMQVNFPKMRHWGLIEGGENNTWRMTSLGVDFILGRRQIFKFVWLYNKTAQNPPDGFVNPLIWAWDVSPKKITKETVLADAVKYPREEAKQLNFF
jgi:hypothetical protein